MVSIQARVGRCDLQETSAFHLPTTGSGLYNKGDGGLVVGWWWCIQHISDGDDGDVGYDGDYSDDVGDSNDVDDSDNVGDSGDRPKAAS